MEVKHGYKQTEVGIIPEDWETPLLDSVAKRGSGHTPDKAHPEYWGGTIKWVSLQDSERLDHVHIRDTAEQITPLGIKNSSANLLPAGTVVLSRDAGVGKSAVISEDMAVSQHFMAWTCSTKLFNYFLYYILQFNKHEFERIAMGNTIKTIGLSYFRRLAVPLPCRAEQDAIAEALSDADALIESLEQLIAKKRHLKQGAMQELLTGKRRLPGFSGNWKTMKLADLATFFSGGTPPTEVREYYDGNIPWITSGDLNRSYLSDVAGRISKSGLNNSAARMIQRNTLLLALYGATAGVTAISLMEGAINQAVLAIVPHSDSAMFLFFKLSHMKDLLISTYTQGGQPNLSGEIVKSIEFGIPGLPEQTAIASVLSDMDTEIEAFESRLAKARQIKQGMMQELLTGRIRLV